MTFVAPRFAAVFEQSRMAIPLPTQIMLSTSKWLQAYGWMLVAAAVAGQGLIYQPSFIVADDLRLVLRHPAVLGAVRPEEQGKASGVNSTVREVGGSLGIAVLAAG